ncbi:hypothetical protein Tco_0071483 [Tanacetum coccineum]
MDENTVCLWLKDHQDAFEKLARQQTEGFQLQFDTLRAELQATRDCGIQFGRRGGGVVLVDVRNGLITTWAKFEESVKNCFGPSKYEDPRGALLKLLQLGTVEDYQQEFKKLMNRNIKEKAYTTLSLPSKEASLVVKGPLDASEDTLLSLLSKDPNFKIQEKAIEYVRVLNVAPLEVVFAGPVDEIRGKFAEFSEDKGCVEKVLSATKLPEGGNSRSTYSLYHLEGKVIFEGVENVTPWAADGGRRKKVKCYVQGSRRRKRKKVNGCGSGRRASDLFSINKKSYEEVVGGSEALGVGENDDSTRASPLRQGGCEGVGNDTSIVRILT